VKLNAGPIVIDLLDKITYLEMSVNYISHSSLWLLLPSQDYIDNMLSLSFFFPVPTHYLTLWGWLLWDCKYWIWFE